MITRLNLFLITLLIAISTCAQDTVWISRTGSVIPTKDSAVSYQLIFRSSTDTSQVKVLKYDISGTMRVARPEIPRAPAALSIPVSSNFWSVKQRRTVVFPKAPRPADPPRRACCKSKSSRVTWKKP